MHITLLGDSIIANHGYCDHSNGGRATYEHLRDLLGSQHTVTTLAADRSTLHDVISRQISRIPASTTHIILSAGGNDMRLAWNEICGGKDEKQRLFRQLGGGGAVDDEDNPPRRSFWTILKELAKGLSRDMRTLLYRLHKDRPNASVIVCLPYLPDHHPIVRNLILRPLRWWFCRYLRGAAKEFNANVLDLVDVIEDPVTELTQQIEPSNRGGWVIASAMVTELVGVGLPVSIDINGRATLLNRIPPNEM